MTMRINTTEQRLPEVRGYLYKPKKSPYFQGIVEYIMDGKEFRKSRTTRQKTKSKANCVVSDMVDYELKMLELGYEPEEIDYRNHMEELHPKPKKLEIVEEEVDSLEKVKPETDLACFLQLYGKTLSPEWSGQGRETIEGYVDSLNNHVLPYFRDNPVKLCEVRPYHFRSYVDYIMAEKKFKGNTVSRQLVPVRLALDYALEHPSPTDPEKGLVEMNAARMIISPKSKQYVAKTISIEQIIDLWMACLGTTIEPAVFLTTIYGFRRGEVLGLKWPVVNFNRRVLPINETRTRYRKEIVKGPKNESSHRTMPLLRCVEIYLQRLYKKQMECRKYWRDAWADSDYICINEIGDPLSISTLNTQFKKVLEKAGLPDMRFHDIRHSVATYLLELGVSIEEVSAWLGHKNIATTARIYAHVNFRIRMGAANRIDRLLGFDFEVEEFSLDELTVENCLEKIFLVSPKKIATVEQAKPNISLFSSNPSSNY